MLATPSRTRISSGFLGAVALLCTPASAPAQSEPLTVPFPLYGRPLVLILTGLLVMLVVLTAFLVTRRRQALAALRMIERRFLLLLEDSRDAIYVTTRSGTFLVANRAMLDLFGYGADELRSLNAQALYVDPRQRERFHELVERTGRVRNLDAALRKRDGTVMSCQLSCSVLRDADGAVVGYQGIVSDVTGRKRVEDAVRRSEEKFRRMVGRSWDMIVLTDEHGVAQFVTDSVARVLGYSVGEYVGTNPLTRVHPDDLQTAKDALQELLAAPKHPVTTVYRAQHKDGSWRWLEVAGTNLLADDHVRAIVANCRDITLRREAEDAQEKLVGALSDRLKELRCLLSVAETVLVLGPLSDIFREVLQIIPCGCRYPDITRGKIRYEREEYVAQPFDETRWKLSYDILTGSDVRGSVEVYLLEEPPESLEDSFSDEERTLMEGIAHLLSEAAQRREAGERLLRSERLLSEAQAIAKTGNWEWDVETGTMAWSDELRRMVGFESGEVTPTFEQLRGLLHDQDCTRVDWVVKDMFAFGSGCEIEFRMLGRDGAETWVYVVAELTRDDGGAPLRLVGTAQDITERKQMEQALRESEEKFATAFQAGPDLMAITRLADGMIVDVNGTFERVYGYAREELIGRTIAQVDFFVRPEKRRELVRALGGPTRTAIVEAEVRAKSGEIRMMRIAASIVRLKDEPHIISIATDLTEQRRAEEQVTRSHQQLRRLAARLHDVREDERTDLARALHDELGQKLTGLRIDLGWLAERLPQRDKAAIDRLRAMARLADETLKATQEISVQLRPPMLDVLGLGPAVEWHVQDFCQRFGLECVVDLPPVELELESARATVAFRILQEALINVARHAQAGRVRVSLQAVDGLLVLEVYDDGVGIREDQISDPRSLGLLGMSERALAFGGSLEVQGLPDGGTRLEASIPLIGLEGVSDQHGGDGA